MLTKIKKILIPILIIALAVAGFVYMKSTKPEQKQVEVKEKTWMVNTIAVQFETLSPVQTLYGTVESFALVEAAAPVSGVIQQVWVREGQEVAKGDPLVAMDKSDLQIPLTQAKAELANASAQLKLQRLTNQANKDRLAHEKEVLKLKQTAVKRAKQLMQRNLASQSTVDTAIEALARQEYTVVGAQLAVEQNKSLLNQAQANLNKAQASLQQAEVNVQRGELVAPYDARISKVHVSAGSRVNAGSVMLTFYALDSLELRAKLPVSETAKVQKALTENRAMYAYGYGFQGEQKMLLLRLAGQASTSGLDAFFGVPASMQDKRPGELMEVRLKGLARENVIALPYSALYGTNRIYIVESGRLQVQTVSLVGEVMRDGKLWALVQADLAEGTKVSITHLPNAASGLKVLEVTE